ncbi:MAG: EAL domain-containing protein [Pseudomonadota bacterium]
MRFLLIAAVLVLALPAAAAKLPLAPDSPFRLYSVAEGLNQKAVHALAQDRDGFLWIATFGGLNRFDGQTFESLTTRDGLRQNLIQALTIDSENRLWAGDAGGGLTLIESGEVVRTFDPDPDVRGVVRGIAVLGDTLYVGSQPGGVRALSISNMEQGFRRVPNAPDEIYALESAGSDSLYAVSPDGLFHLTAGRNRFELIRGDVSAVAVGGQGNVAVGTESGRVGWLRSGRIEWLRKRYDESVSGLVVEDGAISWVFLSEGGLVAYGSERIENTLSLRGAASPMRDQDGVLWLPTRRGLARYLGPRFSHYSVEVDGQSVEIFSIQPGTHGDFWLGSNRGLLHLGSDSSITNVSDTLGIERREVRDIRISSDEKTLWFGQVQGATYGIDLSARRITKASVRKVGGDDALTLSLTLDHRNRVWRGTFLGQLTMLDPITGEVRLYDLGKGASVYSLDMADDNYLWFGVNFAGIYRIDTSDPNAEPELMVAEADAQQEYYTHVVAEGAGDKGTVWFAGIKGSVFKLQNGELTNILSRTVDEMTVYSIQPLPDSTIVVATSRGVYRYSEKSGMLEHYGALDGFVALEAKVHATYFDGDKELLIGTASGFTAMDVSLPFDGVAVPKAQITRREVDSAVIGKNGMDESKLKFDQVLIEFTAVSTRRPNGIEYSYRLTGHDSSWSRAAKTKSITYSNLPPGPYAFSVRARLPGGIWSTPSVWSFTVPTPLWRQPWFIASVVAGTLALGGFLVHLRLRSIARINQRLREQVAERTRSLEEGRRELQATNNQLSSEIQERKKSDALRAEVETRFHQAYQNSPMGMALVDPHGLVYDVNPRMQTLFWPDYRPNRKVPLLSIVNVDDRARFEAFLGNYSADSGSSTSMEVSCRSHDGTLLRIDFHPSAIRDHEGRLQYIVLLAHDVTESRAMTDQLEYQARFDELTGLVNRRAFSERLNSLARHPRKKRNTYLMFLDLDQFKVVNDTCGHAAGDELLCMVADTLRGCVREHDTVARLGGDEFALIITGCTEAQATERAERIRAKIQNIEFLWDNEVFRVGASIGVVPIGTGSADLNELQQLADAACYAAKDAGRNRVHMVTSTEDAAHERRGEMRWVQRLNQAIDTGSFELFGQRIQALGEQERDAERIEILLRMRDRKSNRLIPPGAFLPAAERFGLQGRLDLWVVNQMIDCLEEGLAKDGDNLEYWVNLSGASVGDPQISRALIQRIESANLRPGSLNFEITETAVIRKIGEAKQFIESLRNMGCRFALDDFGSGLSSFGYLKQLSVDFLKVDGQFVRDINVDPTGRIFVKSIIDIAHTLGMAVIVEFVENEEILEIVKELGSDYAQGFHVHRPEPIAKMTSGVTGASALKNQS